MKILCVFGQHNYGDPARGEGYEYTNFLPALERLGEVVFFESFSRSHHAGFTALNRAFLDTVAREDPDVIFCVLMGYELWLETLLTVRRCFRAAMIHWSTDDSWKYARFSRFVAPAFDLYATTSEWAFQRAREAGLNQFARTQWAASADRLLSPKRAPACRYPVSFIGSAYGNRGRWVDGLRKAGINVHCFGHGWPNGPVAAGDIPLIMNDSVISLNFGDSGLVWNGLMPHRSRQIKARTFEVPGAGGFLLTENAPGLAQCYRIGEEIATFASAADLARTIRHYLIHARERDRVAQAGYRRTCLTHTYDQRFAELIPEAIKAREKRGAPASDSVFRNMREEWENAARKHALPVGLRILKWVLVNIFTPIWGPRRGRRAARRLVYELSWRLVGRHTYTAAGWPGRMFYEES